MKKIVVLVCMVMSVCFAYSQTDPTLHFGLKAAPSLAWFRTDSKVINSDGSKFGFAYGLITDFKFADHYYFGTGVDVAYRGGKFKSVSTEDFPTSSTTTSSTAKYTLQYIEIPVTLKFKTNEIGYLTYFLQIGVAPGLNIRARESGTSIIQTTPAAGPTTTTNESVDDIDIMKDINNLNFSLIVGGGVEYTLSGSTVLLAGIQFNNGFLDVFDSDEKVNSNYLALTIGILF